MSCFSINQMGILLRLPVDSRATLSYICCMVNTPGLRKFMALKNLTVSKLAVEIEVDRSTISRVCRGEQTPSKKTIDKIIAACRRLDPTMTYEDLFGGGA
jgi:DNA-binding XRE family transcriptional regulator